MLSESRAQGPSRNTWRCTPFDSLVCLAPEFRSSPDQRFLIPRMGLRCVTPTAAFPAPSVQPSPCRCPCLRIPRSLKSDDRVQSDDKDLPVWKNTARNGVLGMGIDLMLRENYCRDLVGLYCGVCRVGRWKARHCLNLYIFAYKLW